MQTIDAPSRFICIQSAVGSWIIVLRWSIDRSRCNSTLYEHVVTVFGPVESFPLWAPALSVSFFLSQQPAKIRLDSEPGGEEHNCGLDERGPTTRPARSNLEEFYGNSLPYSLRLPCNGLRVSRSVHNYPRGTRITPVEKIKRVTILRICRGILIFIRVFIIAIIRAEVDGILYVCNRSFSIFCLNWKSPSSE